MQDCAVTGTRRQPDPASTSAAGGPLSPHSQRCAHLPAVVALAMVWDTRWLRDIDSSSWPHDTRPLRPETIQRRLVDIRALLDVLRRHADITGAQLRADLERRLMVERALQRVVDLAGRSMSAPTHGSERAAPSAARRRSETSRE